MHGRGIRHIFALTSDSKHVVFKCGLESFFVQILDREKTFVGLFRRFRRQIQKQKEPLQNSTLVNRN